MMRHTIILSTIMGLYSALSLSCSTAPIIPDIRLEIIESWAETIIEPHFDRFADAATHMATESSDVCDDLSQERLETMRTAWQAARQRWKYLEPFYFGPHSDPPGRIGQTIDFWPAREGKIIELIDDDFELSAEAMQRQGAIVRGFPVLEYLLYVGVPDTLSALRSSDRRCQMLTAVAGDLEYLAESLRDAWTDPMGGFLKTITQPQTGEFMTPRAALGEIVNRMGFAIENIRRDRLGAPLGDKSGGALQPDSVESRFSGRSIEDIHDVLKSVETLVHGAVDNARSLGLVDHPSLQGRPEVVRRFDDALARSRAALNAIPNPLREHLTETVLVRGAFDALGDVQRSIQADFMNVLGLSLSFNDADGD